MCFYDAFAASRRGIDLKYMWEFSLVFTERKDNHALGLCYLAEHFHSSATSKEKYSLGKKVVKKYCKSFANLQAN